MLNSEIRAEARELVKGKRTPYIVWFLVVLVLGFVSAIPIIGAVLAVAVTGAMELGLAGIDLKVVRKEKIETNNIFDGFKNFVNAFVTYLLQGIYLFLWSLLIIPAFIKPFSYAMTYYILQDNPDMSANDAITKSRKMMDGHKWKLFCLHFSFIGWHILSIFTFGILYFWLMPYIRTATARFYQDIKKEEAEANTNDKDYIELDKKDEKKICPLCGKENDSDSKFCYRCGERLDIDRFNNSSSDKKICPECGAENENDSNYCIKCGKKLD